MNRIDHIHEAELALQAAGLNEIHRVHPRIVDQCKCPQLSVAISKDMIMPVAVLTDEYRDAKDLAKWFGSWMAQGRDGILVHVSEHLGKIRWKPASKAWTGVYGWRHMHELPKWISEVADAA